jgi:hypothetical protein
MNTTPETDALIAADLHHLEYDQTCPASAYWRMAHRCKEMERQRNELTERLREEQRLHIRTLDERDEARILCRWAFPRLRAMCHDADNEGTGWCCDEEMRNHPEIFDEKTPPRDGEG